MKLTEYLHDQLKFLNDQMNSAKKDKDETMQYLVDSKITEVKLILEALQKALSMKHNPRLKRNERFVANLILFGLIPLTIAN